MESSKHSGHDENLRTVGAVIDRTYRRGLVDPSRMWGQSTSPLILTMERSGLWRTAAVLLALIAGVAGCNQGQQAPLVPSRMDHVLPEGQEFAITDRLVVAVSPDGSAIVYVANQQLYLRAMDGLDAAPISGTDDLPTSPFFSPDGRRVGYWSGVDRQLKMVAVNGGAPVTLSVAEDPYYGAPVWGDDDTIVWGQGEGIMRISANGGRAELLIEGEGNLINPQILPDGESVLFHVGTAEDGQVAIESLNSGERKLLFPGVGPRYVPTGHIIYAVNDVLFAVGFDLGTLAIEGAPVAIADGVRPGPPQYGVSDSGALVFVPGSETGGNTLVWVDREGNVEPLGTPARNYTFPRLSPNGRSVLVRIDDDLWLFDIAEEALTRLTFGARANLPVWSADGQFASYRSIREGTGNMFWTRADGTGTEEQLTRGDFTQQNPSSWSRDGQLLAFYQIPGVGGSGDRDLWVMPLDGNREPRPFLQTALNEAAPNFSPDGQLMAYVSNESGANEIFVRPFPGPGSQWQISTEGGGGPIWAQSGRELFYMNGSQLMAVDIETETGFSAGVPRLLVENRFRPSTGNVASYDATADGQRFVMIQDAVVTDIEALPDQINIVGNWLEQLQERVPVP
jgi:Tol biopolymer transport system component